MFDINKFLIECGRHILDDEDWPEKSTRIDIQGYSVEAMKTPHGTFRMLQFDCANGHRLVLIQSNPAKVPVDPRNKVMVYDENGGARQRTGQMRRKGDKYSFTWF